MLENRSLRGSLMSDLHEPQSLGSGHLCGVQGWSLLLLVPGMCHVQKGHRGAGSVVELTLAHL